MADTRSDRTGNGGVQVIARAAQILRALGEHPEGIRLSPLAKSVGLARSTAHRIVGALQAERLVTEASSSGRLRLGPDLALLGASVNRDLRRELRPYLERLFAEVDETIDLGVLEDGQVLFVDQVAAPHRLRAVAGIGMTFPLHCTANGKALLSELTSEEVARCLPEPLPSLTPNTCTSRAALAEELDRIRREHIAYDREEHTTGICAVSIALRDPAGRLAAISIPTPSTRFQHKERKLVSALMDTRKLLSHRFEPL